MQWLEQLSDILSRAVYLLSLSVIPSGLSPEPGPFGWPARISLVLAFPSVIYLALRLHRKLPGALTNIGLGLFGMAALLAISLAFAQRGTGMPLGAGVLYIAPPLWMALAALMTEAANRRFALGRRPSRIIAPLLVLVSGAALLFHAPWLLSSRGSWLEVLAREPRAAFAMNALLREPLRKQAYDVANELVDRCFEVAPDGCACHADRAEIAMRSKQGGAIAHARTAADKCPDDAEIRAILAEALTVEGEADWAEQEARAALSRGNHARLHHALAMALDRKGQPAEAIEEAKLAIELGAGRDSVLLLGALLVASGDLENATSVFHSLVSAYPSDAAAFYNLALIADKEGDYNRARQGYLSALRADPRLASARYNLAILAYRHQVIEEARHHAESFAETFPEDPRGASLLRMTQGR